MSLIQTTVRAGELSWTDGTPTGSDSGNGNGVKVNNVGSSLTFTAPASTAERTLKVYAFGWYSNMELEVSVSDSSFTTWTSSTTGSGSGHDTGTYRLCLDPSFSPR